MKCFTVMKTRTDSIRLHRFGSKYAVWIMGSGDMAYVSLEDFDEMVSRGHASRSPRIIENSDWSRAVPRWGAWIYRCDFKRDEKERLWLIPEQRDSKNALVWAPRFCDHRTTKAINYPPSQTLVTRIDFWQREHLLILLTPDNPISWYKHTRKKVDGSGPSWRHPLRRAQYEPDAILLRRLQVNYAGELLG